MFVAFSGCKLFGKDHNLLPEITNDFLKDHLYYSVSSNCLRIDACTDFSIDLGANIPAYTKAFRAFIDVDFCKFIISFGFEGWKETLVLISYDWGRLFKTMKFIVSTTTISKTLTKMCFNPKLGNFINGRIASVVSWLCACLKCLMS